MKIWNRLDNFLAWISGSADADKTMDPRNPREYWLKQIAENGGSGYTVTEETVTIIPEQTVEAVEHDNDFNYYAVELECGSFENLPQTVAVVYNGVEYNNLTLDDVPDYHYGASLENLEEGEVDFSAYPFAIVFFENDETYNASLFTESPATVTIKAESVSKTVTPSEDFVEAVKASGAGGGLFQISVADNTLDKTYAEIKTAFESGMVCVLNYKNWYCYLVNLDEYDGTYKAVFYDTGELSPQNVTYSANSADAPLVKA